MHSTTTSPDELLLTFSAQFVPEDAIKYEGKILNQVIQEKFFLLFNFL